ncbi:AraC-like DNA-binding protein [Streptomyces sp. 846.5]|nr:helix-turn-helix domain-containing protein [Streptomyces sp. 846.5]TDU02139.1 AraC-like DNA-binding protein [Streptomyces sp. 846.5]
MLIETVRCNEDLPAGDRFEWWREMILRSAMPALVSSDHTEDFRAKATELHLGPSRVSVLAYPPMRISRTSALVRRSDPQLYHLHLALRGDRGMSQCGRETILSQGSLLLSDTSHPYSAQSFGEEGMVEGIMIDIPRSALPLPSAKADRLLGTALPGKSGTGALLSQFLTRLTAEYGSLQVPDASRLGAVLTDLVAVFLAHHLDAADAVTPESRHQALMVAIHAFIEHNLGDAALSPTTVAAAHHISVRYLHLLFQRQSTTVSAWIRHRRLERCRRDLTDLHWAQLPIHAVAARWGFRHPEEFSRAFRARYGAAPRDYREQYRRAT